jgi:four helix bundle protein
MAVKSYRDLIAWQKAMDLVVDIYEVTKEFPRDELYGLTSQTRRSAVSIPCNIAEGQARDSTKEFAHFLSISYGSTAELETQLLIAERLGFIGHEQTTDRLEQCAEVGRIINGLRRSLPTS